MDWTPQNPDAWRELATVAEAMLDIAIVRGHGLLPPVPEIDADRCRRVIAGARARGIVADAADVNRTTAQLMQQFFGAPTLGRTS